MKRYLFAVLAYLLPTFAIGFVWHLVVFQSYYEALAIYRREVIIPFGFLSMLIQAATFALLYEKAFLHMRGGLLSRSLRYGAVGINHWPALVYAMMSPPWGGYPCGTLADAQSGIGTVHNTFMLEGVEKTLLEGPITLAPKPFWFPTHKRPEPIAWKVLELYGNPSVWKLPSLALAALGG